MSSIQFLGSYLSNTKKMSISACKEEWISRDQILSICKHIAMDGIVNLTIELSTDSFINFEKNSDEIRFVGGPLTEYGRLHNSLSTGDFEVDDNVGNLQSNDDLTSLNVRDSELQESALIHNSLFPPLSEFKKSFRDAEVYFKPYESPGGDFYWVKKYQYKSVIIVGDCTGHGIQGAMIAMSVITLLKQHFKLPPAQSIKRSIIEFYSALKEILEEQDLNIFDVEMGIILRDHRTNKAEYIGSGVNLIVKSESDCTPYSSRKARLMSGKQLSYDLELNTGDQLFLFSDGITDQFDAINQKKLGLKALVLMIEGMNKMVDINGFTSKFNEFRGTTKSLDDQTLLLLTV